MNRRTFLKHLGWGSAALAARPVVHGPWFHGPASRETDIVIFGGGAGGLCAGLQAARMGAEVLLLEPSPWIGGMLTAAGVSALDGNKHGAGGGLVHTFRQRLADHYGSLDALFTGWISLYGYEPHVGHRIVQEWVAAEERVTVLHGVEATRYERVAPNRRRITLTPTPDGLAPPDCSAPEETVTCRLFIDATEYGDGLPLAGIPYRLGRESRDAYGEPPAPPEADAQMQDLTYAATLVRQPGAAPMPSTPQEQAAWDEFRCSTTADCDASDPERLGHTVHSWERFITYAALPNDKYLLNWPHHANDFPVSRAFFEDRFYRARQLRAAKQHTLQFIKYLQTELEHPEWQIATDEYPTADHLPPLPYIRECRRMVNDHVLRMQDVVPTEDNPRAPIQTDAIAVGDYFIDHHHAAHHLPSGCRLTEDYPDNAPFQVPISVFLPPTDDPCVLVAEKSIAVTHIVNGCTRLQPVVMLMGQAVGALAAQAVDDDVAPASVAVERVQEVLLDAGCPLYAMYDVPTGHPLFRAVQELARAGVLRADDPTRLKPDAPMPSDRAAVWTQRANMPASVSPAGTARPLQREEVHDPLRTHLPSGASDDVTRGAFVHAMHAALDPR